MVHKIVLKIGKQKIELTPEQAKELRDELVNMFSGFKKVHHHHHHNSQPYYYTPWWTTTIESPGYYEITMGSSTTLE